MLSFTDVMNFAFGLQSWLTNRAGPNSKLIPPTRDEYMILKSVLPAVYSASSSGVIFAIAPVRYLIVSPLLISFLASMHASNPVNV